MGATYLYLNSANRTNNKWSNLPTISQSTRECYLTVTYARLIFATGSGTPDGITLKMKVPVSNYFSSSNDEPVVCMLNGLSGRVYAIPEGPPKISLLTNDNLKNIEFLINDEFDEPIVLVEADRLEVLFKIDYIDQEAMTEKYISEIPVTLAGRAI